MSLQLKKNKAQNKKKQSSPSQEETSLFVSIKDIKPNPHQPRNYFNETKIEELALSIKEKGIIQPILVNKIKTSAEDNKKFSIIAGERRFRAAKKAGLTFVPVCLLQISEEEVFEVALIENLQREDLNAIETALSFKNLLRLKKHTHQELASKLGISRSVITNTLRLLSLPLNIQDAVKTNAISMSHARYLLSFENEKTQQENFNKIIKTNISVHSLEKKKTKEKKSFASLDKTLEAYQQNLIEYFGTKVLLQGSLKKGIIKIEYYNSADLERVLKLLKISL